MKVPNPLARSVDQVRRGTDTPGWWNLAGIAVLILLGAYLAFSAISSDSTGTALAPPSSYRPSAAPGSTTPSPTSTAGTVTMESPSGDPVTVALPAATLAQSALQAAIDPAANASQPWDGPPAPAVAGFTPGRVSWSPITVTSPGVGTYVVAATVTSTDNPSQRQQVSRTIAGAGETWKVRASP